ncbi:DUF6782 family putative metallopeptidase [Azospirillum argentinense]
MDDARQSAERGRLIAALAGTPTGRRLVKRAKASGLRIKVTSLAPDVEGEYSPADGCVLLSEALSDAARIAVFAHELRHAEQRRFHILDLLERTPPLDSLMAGRAIEADAEAVSHLVCWELRRSDPAPWAYLSGHWRNSDIAAAVARTAPGMPPGTVGTGALRAAFRAYADVSDRLTGCDRHRVACGLALEKVCRVAPGRRPEATATERLSFAWRTFAGKGGVAWRLPERGRAVLRMLAALPVEATPYLTDAEMADALRLDARGGAQYSLHALEMSVFGRSVSGLHPQDPRPLASRRLARIVTAATPVVIAQIAGSGSGHAATLAAVVAAHPGGALRGATAGEIWTEFGAALRAAHDAADERYWSGALGHPSRLALMDALDGAAELAEGLKLMASRAPSTTF